MTIYFGLGLDNDIQIAEKVQAGIHYVGANRMLAILETQMGFQGYPSGNEHLRIEQYRQALTTHLEEYPESFYRNSFLADQMATATEMLSRRDELLLSGWDFEHKSADLPARLAVLGQLEALIFVNLYDEKLKEDYQITLSPGFSDRFQQILRHVEKRKNNIEQIYTLEPSPILPNHFQRLFECLKKEGTKVESIPQTPINGDSDLANFQTLLLPNTPRKKHTLKQDGSLLLLQCKRETDGADYLAKLLRKNPNWKPHILMTEKNRTLDTALIQEGLPSMGILSASLARPMLQIIKLAPTFLWNPIDPFKLMEFVNLKVKPLEEELSNRIAQQLAQAPGIGGEGWAIMLKNYFDEIEAKAQNDSYINAGEIRQQYNFWFRRDRYSTAQRVPIEEVIEFYNYLKEWSFQAFEDSGNRSQSLLVLSEQAKRIEELLNTLPESALSYLELERIIRTIYEPSPVAFRAQEV
ncbi:MAG: hypothetical protein AAFO82_13595, partial [Bacteroidota bacterium]